MFSRIKLSLKYSTAVMTRLDFKMISAFFILLGTSYCKACKHNILFLIVPIFLDVHSGAWVDMQKTALLTESKNNKKAKNS